MSGSGFEKSFCRTISFGIASSGLRLFPAKVVVELEKQKQRKKIKWVVFIEIFVKSRKMLAILLCTTLLRTS